MLDVANNMCADAYQRRRRLWHILPFAAVWVGVALLCNQASWSAERWNDSFMLAGETEEQLEFPSASMPDGSEGEIVEDIDVLPPPSRPAGVAHFGILADRDTTVAQDKSRRPRRIAPSTAAQRFDSRFERHVVRAAGTGMG